MTMQLCDFEGGKIWLDTSANEMQALMAETRWEWRKVEYMKRYLQPGMTFADVGAFNGYFSLIAAKLVGETGRVFAFEPNADNAHRFEMNVHASGLKNILLEQVAVSDHNGTITFYLNGPYSSSIPQSESQDAAVIPCGSLDRFLNRPIDMMKIDVEGMEFAVLQGARQMILKSHPIHLLMDLHPEFGMKPNGVETFLYEHRFNLFSIRDGFAPIEHIPDSLVELLAVK